MLGQFTQPLAVLLMVAAVLAWFGGTPQLAVAVVAVILLNAGFAFVQERQAERAVEALAAYLPETARALRGGGSPWCRPSSPATSSRSPRATGSPRSPKEGVIVRRVQHRKARPEVPRPG